MDVSEISGRDTKFRQAGPGFPDECSEGSEGFVDLDELLTTSMDKSARSLWSSSRCIAMLDIRWSGELIRACPSPISCFEIRVIIPSYELRLIYVGGLDSQFLFLNVRPVDATGSCLGTAGFRPAVAAFAVAAFLGTAAFLVVPVFALLIIVVAALAALPSLTRPLSGDWGATARFVCRLGARVAFGTACWAADVGRVGCVFSGDNAEGLNGAGGCGKVREL